MFGHRQRLRTLASHMLLVWVLALMSTVVNACIVVPHGAAAGAVPAVQSGAAQAHPCHDAAGAQDPQQPKGAKSACAKFCDEDGSGATSAQRVTDAMASVGVALVPTMALAVRPPLQAAAVKHASGDSLPACVPVSIAFLRLTL